jgi:hypothetical protein
MASASEANLDVRFPATTSPIPLGGSPTGTGESPVPPIFKQVLKHAAGVLSLIAYSDELEKKSLLALDFNR